MHILPNLEQEELYSQFRLDQPWDSPNNKQLIARMPAVFADPDPAVRQRNIDGRTKYVVPTGPEAVFAGNAGASIRDIADGTSNTIMAVEMANRASPVWTRPKDWFVNFSNRWERIQQQDRDWFTTAFCDGSVRIIPLSTDAEMLRRLLQLADGEAVELP